MNLEGKNILLVGANGHLGGLLKAELQHAGAHVISTYHRHPIENALQLDLTDEASIANLGAQLGDTKLDGLVIAAGVVAFGSAESTPAQVVADLMSVNATGVISLITKLTANLQGPDSFIVTLSGKVAELPTAGIAAYSASKSALYAYSVAAGRELRRAGIRWIDARPGHTETGLANRAIFGEAPNFPAGLSPESVAKRILKAITDGEKDLPSSAFEN